MVVTRVGVWSVARLYGAIGACIGVLVGAMFALGATIGSLAGSSSDTFFRGGIGALFGVGALILAPLFYGIVSLICGAIGAALYNLFAGIFGGVEVELNPGDAAFNRHFFEKKADA